ncbi:hypothetical protein BKA65DRAFT_505312 [Rhexocercosporidium sp. MPI-PUGE-AT-0058]|nr:hypothetical protein BKA65DRAFT_505312 [Rhexocercosporidium sp. MPI-PUGE-AT-0058]
MSSSKFKDMLKLVPDKKKRYWQEVPEVQKAEIPIASFTSSPLTGELVPIAVVPPMKPGTSMFPNETVLYKESYRDIVISTLYDETLQRPLPLFYIAIGFTSIRVSNTGSSDAENTIIPVTLHYGPDKTGPILGYVESIEKNSKGTILNTVYDPTAQFKTTILDIGVHLTKEYCEFKFSVPSELDPAVKEMQVFRWKQCEHHPAVLSLCSDRVLPSHDWCMLDRKNERGMCLFQLGSEADVATAANAEEAKGKFWGMGKTKKPKLEDREVLAVFVSAKLHSKMNPVKIAARIRWLENEVWSEQLKLAAFLAVMTFGEKSRRVGTGGGL